MKIAGRITALRDMRKSVFFQLGDVFGSIQGYVGIKNLSDEQAAAWKCLDRGDWIGIEGETFLTKTGEPPVKVENFAVLSKKYRKRHQPPLGLPQKANSCSLNPTHVSDFYKVMKQGAQ